MLLDLDGLPGVSNLPYFRFGIDAVGALNVEADESKLLLSFDDCCEMLDDVNDVALLFTV